MESTHFLVVIVAVLLLQSCIGKSDFSGNNNDEKEHLLSFCSIDSVEDTTITISNIADTILYFKLNRPATQKEVFQAFYDEEQIVIYDLEHLSFYSLYGVENKKISCPYACIDYDIENKIIHIYEFRKKQITVLANDGSIVNRIHLKTKEIGFWGQYFAFLNDSTYAIAKVNATGNDGGLLFVSSTGTVVGHKSPEESFKSSPNSYIFNMSWEFPIIRSPQGVCYYPCYSDSLFWLNGKDEITPFFAETVLKKVPLENRTEVSGTNRNEYIIQCNNNRWACPRYYVNERFVLAQYTYGRARTDLPGYLLADRKTGKVQSFKNSFSESIFHFGIFNDVDGGLAFTPLNQSGEYLVMAGAGFAQGGMGTYPKTLLTQGRMFGNKSYTVVSKVSKNKENEKRLGEFFSAFDESEHTMITVLRIKK